MTVLDHALGYARIGWRVAPVKPGTRWPRIDAWQENASTERSEIERWWTQWPDSDVSVVCGRESRLWVLDVDVKNHAGGDESLAMLIEEHGPLGDTLTVQTPSGGRHYYWRWPEGDVELTTSASQVAPGIDVRATGGQVVAPPSMDGGYVWSFDGGDPLEGELPAYAPEWLVRVVVEAARERHVEPRRARRTDADMDLPGDYFAATVSWAAMLEADGWTLHSVHGGTELWTRPGKDKRDGPSASLYYGGSDTLKVFSSAPELTKLGLEAGKTYERFGYLAASRYGGDHAAAARAVRTVMPRRPAIVLAGSTPSRPTKSTSGIDDMLAPPVAPGPTESDDPEPALLDEDLLDALPPLTRPPGPGIARPEDWHGMSLRADAERRLAGEPPERPRLGLVHPAGTRPTVPL